MKCMMVLPRKPYFTDLCIILMGFRVCVRFWEDLQKSRNAATDIAAPAGFMYVGTWGPLIKFAPISGIPVSLDPGCPQTLAP